MIIQKLKNGIKVLTLGLIQFEKKMTQGSEKLQLGAENLSKKMNELRIRQMVDHEIDHIALQKKYPDIDVKEIRESAKYSFNKKKTEEEKEHDNQKYRELDAKNRVKFADIIEDLKLKHPTLDWATLEEKIIVALRY